MQQGYPTMGLRKILRPMTSTSASMTQMALRGSSIQFRLVPRCKPLPNVAAFQQLHGTVTVLAPPEKMRDPALGQVPRTWMDTCCCWPGDSTPTDGLKETWSNPLLDADHATLP